MFVTLIEDDGYFIADVSVEALESSIEYAGEVMLIFDSDGRRYDCKQVESGVVQILATDEYEEVAELLSLWEAFLRRRGKSISLRRRDRYTRDLFKNITETLLLAQGSVWRGYWSVVSTKGWTRDFSSLRSILEYCRGLDADTRDMVSVWDPFGHEYGLEFEFGRLLFRER